MTGPRFASFTAPSSYWQASRAPRYSLLFALPLLVFYQVLAVWLAAGPRHEPQAAADEAEHEQQRAPGPGHGGGQALQDHVGGLWLVARDMRAHGSRLKRWVFLGMLAESL